MTKCAASILSADFANLGRDIGQAAANGCDWIHVDVMDGLFVPNLSMGLPVTRAVRRVTSLPIDVHLMIDRPLRYVQRFAEAGADYVTIHLEADNTENNLSALDIIHKCGAKAGVALKPGTPAEALLPYLGKTDLVLVMTVEPGFGGQKFMEDQLPKLRAVREMLGFHNSKCLLSVDGGVDLRTQAMCKERDADVLVAGSAYFKAEDPQAFVKVLRGC